MLHGSKCYCHKCVWERVNNRPATPTAKQETSRTKSELPYEDSVNAVDSDQSTKVDEEVPVLSRVNYALLTDRSMNTIVYYLERLSNHLLSRKEDIVANDVKNVTEFLKEVHLKTWENKDACTSRPES